MFKLNLSRSGQCLMLVLTSLFFSFPALADDPFIVGVGTHLFNKSSYPPSLMKMIRDAGIDSVRDDAYWSTAEPRRGQLHIDASWQSYLGDARQYRLRPLLVLDYGNPFYDNNAKPRSPPVRKAFADYTEFVSRKLGSSVAFYEIWNEWDREDPNDRGLTNDYLALVDETAQRIRSQNSDVKILAGAVTNKGIDLGFANRLVEAGVLAKVDGLSLHPSVYCRNAEHRTPEHWIGWMRDVAANLKSLANRPVPLYVTEMGWPSNDGKCGVDEQTQAAYLARSFFLARTVPEIKGIWWYDLLNDGVDRSDLKQNFGLLQQDAQPKPAYRTLKVISPVLREFAYEPEKSRLDGPHYLLRFSRDAEQILVAWTTAERQPIRAEASSVQHGNVQIINTGEPEKGRVDSGIPWQCDDSRCSAQIPIGEFPIIVSLGNRPPLFALQEASPRPRLLSQ
ncbi:hypothetical protein [Pseudomonas sp. NA-150]|uniref:GH39 family glycosyl hydrolase n=1 Tax=Pseudomonas sp. NA-150 TaxID=3367525 RepID=UPI0037CC54B3